MQACRIKYGQCRIFRFNEQRDFGAAKNDRFRAACLELFNHLLKSLSGSIEHLAVAKLFINDAMNQSPVFFLRRKYRKAEFRFKSAAIKIAFHREAGAEQGDGAKFLRLYRL